MVTTYIQLALAAVFPVAASILLYLAESKTSFSKLDYWVRQIIAGVVFGALAIVGAGYSINDGRAALSVCDAAPLCAGLIFGAPAGIIAGVIGGLERWFTIFYKAGEFTRIACSVSICLSGLFAAILRKYMFDDKKPYWYYGLATAIVMEDIHMLLIFLTNLVDVRLAFEVVSLCTIPTIFMNGASVTLALLFVSLIGRKRVKRDGQRNISQTFQRWLLICIIIAFLVTSIFTFGVQSRLSNSDAISLLSLNLKDVRDDIDDASDTNLLRLTHSVAGRIDGRGSADNEFLRELAEEFDVTEIDVIDRNGIIISCTNEDFVGYDMASGDQSSEFLVLLDDKMEMVQSYQPISYDRSVSRKYAGVRLARGGFVQVGYDASRFQEDIDSEVIGITKNRHVGQDGRIIICNEDWVIVSDREGNSGRNLDVTGIWIDRNTMPEGVVFTSEVYGSPSRCMYVVSEGYIIVSVLPESEAVLQRNVAVYVMVFMEIIVFAVMFALIYFLIKKIVVENIQRINSKLSEISDGNLDVSVDVRTNTEFASLSDDINSTVNTLKRYIAEAAARIDKELAFAKAIQHSALPSVFPPFPQKREFDIYASMYTAKEVGGDFYDFYLLSEDELAFLIADVSGKGIPAALFMMTSKTLIKSFAESGCGVAEVFTKANAELCQSNETGMFVTAWLGVLNLKTGLVTFANAGHNPPLVQRADGTTKYLESAHGFVLAGMEGIRYRQNELQLEPGDLLYLYTDGVTEATDLAEKLYGDARLLTVLSGQQGADVRSVCTAIKADVDAFAGEAPQFDDITMLALRYLGTRGALKELTVIPSLESFGAVASFVEDTLAECQLPVKLVTRMNIAVDELFSNIAKYSGARSATVACGVENGSAVLRFTDDGKPYDPTQQADPDVTLPAEEREIGGLGMFMVKKSMDEIVYEYRGGHNILTVKKRL